jgi:hypothetical protein
MSANRDEHRQSAPAPAKKPTLPWLYAIPEGRLPDSIDVAGRTWTLEQTFKHDFFAATGCYVCGSDRAVLKVGRVGSFFGFPLRWIGRRLRDHESRLYRRLEDLPGVPAYLGDVGPTGFAHAYIPGRPLGRRDEVGDRFFDELEALLGEIHAREIAYVDLNKRQNVLLGDDGRPYLIDFQISYALRPSGWRRNPFTRWLLRRFQNADRYHFCKHKRRLRPDLLTAQEREIAERVGFWIRLHRAIARPLIQARRVVLRSLRKREEMDVAGSSAK